VWIDDDAGDPPRHDGTGELARAEQRALDVQVTVDQTGQDVRAVEIHLVGARVVAEADDVAVVDGKVRRARW
jgi:hypothetical protein